jgi:effector-binding domain-containing protein
MSYQIEVVTLKPQPVLVIEEEVAPEAIGEALARIFPAVHGFADRLGAAITGMPFLRYLDMKDGFQIQAGVPVAEPVEGTDEIRAAVLPGGKAATTVFFGPYHEVGAAWDAINAWREERGIALTFGGWDIYENDPTEVSDPRELRTRLYQPLY